VAVGSLSCYGSAEETNMESVTVAEAKEHLENLLARAANGEDVQIVDARLGTMRIVPVDSQQSVLCRRTPGLLKGIVHIADDQLFAPLTEEELDDFSGYLRSEIPR